MEIPFVYGKIVSDNDFTDREEETRKLVSNFLSQTNTAIISPRRWGKSSLVNKAIESVQVRDPPRLLRIVRKAYYRMHIFHGGNAPFQRKGIHLKAFAQTIHLRSGWPIRDVIWY